jgi:hypothetical protein
MGVLSLLFLVVHNQLLRFVDFKGEVLFLGVQEAAEQAPLWGPRVDNQRGGGVVAYLHHMV